MQPKAAELIRLQLEEGLRVVIINTAKARTTVGKNAVPALITLDTLLPDESCWILPERMTRTPLLANIPVVVIFIATDQEFGMALGAVSVIQKTYKQDELRATLEKVQQTLNLAEFDEMMF